MEWDNQLPDVAAAHDPADPPADAPPLLTGGHTRRSGRPRALVLLLPVLLVLALAAGAAAFAGVFDGDDGAPAVDKPPAPRVQAPVTTPLPIKVKPKATTPAPTAEGAATDSEAAATGTDGTAGTGATDATGTTP